VLAVVEKIWFALTGWKVVAELANPVNFEAATANITTEQAKSQFACGPDAERHVEVARQFAAAGWDHLVAQNAGPDPGGFMDFFAPRAGRAAAGTEARIREQNAARPEADGLSWRVSAPCSAARVDAGAG
jgi:hypothetical protein